MKTMKMTLAAVAMFITTMTMQAQPMSFYAMRENARFLTDRMAYTLGIATSLLDDLYMINYDYICGVNDYLDDVAYGYHYDDYMAVVYARDAALRRLLTPYQWSRLIALDYFYRPISFVNRRWSFSIYAYDPYRTRFYYGVPHRYEHYHGGHFFRGMAPAGGHMGPHGGPGYHVGGPNRPQHGYDSRHDNYNGNGNYNGNYNGNNGGHIGGGGYNDGPNMGGNGNTNVNVNVNRNVGVGSAVRHVSAGSQTTPSMESHPSSTRQVGGNSMGSSSRGATRQSAAPMQSTTRSVGAGRSSSAGSSFSGSTRSSSVSSGSGSRGSVSSSGGGSRGGSTSGGTRGGGRR